jgi:hydroxymethylpyrimidine pyrophosphatase-like HAD family hydrolase
VRFGLVASDVDGTLLRSDGSLSPRTGAAVQAVLARGPFVIATGRPPRWTRPIAELLGHHAIAVCSNGAVTIDLADESIIETRHHPFDSAMAAVEAVRSVLPDVGFAVDSLDGFGHEPVYVPTPMMPKGARVAPIDELLRTPSLKLLFRHMEMNREVFDAIVAAVGANATITYGSNSSIPEPMTLVELMAPGVSKAAALASLCDRFGVDHRATIAFGDMPNDVEMLAWAGHGVAMANGHPDAHAVADEIAPSNDDDGVAHVLERELG